MQRAPQFLSLTFWLRFQCFLLPPAHLSPAHLPPSINVFLPLKRLIRDSQLGATCRSASSIEGLPATQRGRHAQRPQRRVLSAPRVVTICRVVAPQLSREPAPAPGKPQVSWEVACTWATCQRPVVTSTLGPSVRTHLHCVPSSLCPRRTATFPVRRLSEPVHTETDRPPATPHSLNAQSVNKAKVCKGPFAPFRLP